MLNDSHQTTRTLCLTALMLAITVGAQAAAQSPAKISRDPYIGAIVADADTGRVCFEENADAKAYPASTVKLMVILIVLEKVKSGELRLDESVTVSADAETIGGTQVWLKKGESFTIDELLYALTIRSANDVAVALAEHVSGSRDAFVELMNNRAKELSMTSTVFTSPHGLPPGHGQEPDVTSARDMMILAREVLKHPDAIRYTSERKRIFRNDPLLVMESHNHLLNSFRGCDGLKTGYFLSAGFSVAATAKRGETRVVAVVLGSASRKVRDAKAAELLEKGFSVLSVPPAK